MKAMKKLFKRKKKSQPAHRADNPPTNENVVMPPVVVETKRSDDIKQHIPSKPTHRPPPTKSVSYSATKHNNNHGHSGMNENQGFPKRQAEETVVVTPRLPDRTAPVNASNAVVGAAEREESKIDGAPRSNGGSNKEIPDKHASARADTAKTSSSSTFASASSSSLRPSRLDGPTGVLKMPPVPRDSTASSSTGVFINSNANKGVSDSFKGLAVTQRFDVAEVPGSDPHTLISLGDAYDAIPVLEQIKLPRGGISMETKAVGMVQFGIPPETIKDSMRLGIPVPQVYIVPAERFCREMGPALGVNLAEFEFPAYFNFFVCKKRCTLVVDSQEAQDNICRVFSETLLGPAQFRAEGNPLAYEEEDFAPDFPRDAIPNFQKEMEYFRIMPGGKELGLESMLDFCQFRTPGDGCSHENLGVPPNLDDISGHEDDEEMDEEELDEALDMVGGEETGEEEEVPKDEKGVISRERSRWSYKKARWVGDVATVWPVNASEEEIRNRSVPRVEIFKMPSGTEYILHDIDVNNHIVGKARFSGHVKVSDSMVVEGFGEQSIMGDVKGSPDSETKDVGDDDSFSSADAKESPMIKAPPTFHPPSFGVTILGNSHGFDKSGSVSGYVLWINGRGVMIDPPPYSSATLEGKGIRPRTIVGIIITHCHADHDAGAFQKVLTGSPVVVITTPTIYKSFIRKYAALASLSPALLRHSHRYKPAIIGQPLRFQGATFHFTYSLHSIPCVGFKVEWRGRSMVFTGDHLNKPDEIEQMQTDNVLSKARADDLRNLPLQETDLLLHEAGTPPLHTPLEVLLKLPQRVKKRLYVVHTSSIPADCELRIAPTGTQGTLRLDTFQRGQGPFAGNSTWMERSIRKQRNTRDAYSISLEDDEIMPSPWSSASNEYGPINEGSTTEDRRPVLHDQRSIQTSFGNLNAAAAKKGSASGTHRTSLTSMGGSTVPLVSMRPASSTDAWFILNLLSAVPFLSSLSYSSTMEVLETARVDAYCKNDVVVPSARRSKLLCVVWEGTCVERDRTGARPKDKNLTTIQEKDLQRQQIQPPGAVWHAGDWTGPIALQPDKRLSGESDLSASHDIVAMSSEGVKVITVEFPSLHLILLSGSALYRKYLDRRAQQQRRLSFEVGSQASTNSTATHKLLTDSLKNLNVLELLDQNSALRKLTAVQKRHLESLAEGPVGFGPGERLWRSGAPVDKAFLMVSGTASFVPRRRNAGSASLPPGSMGLSSSTKSMLSRLGDSTSNIVSETSNVGDQMKQDVIKAVEDLGEINDQPSEVVEAISEGQMLQLETLFSRSVDGQARSMTESHDFAKLSKNLQKRADLLSGGSTSDVSVTSSLDDGSGSNDSDHFHSDNGDDTASAGSSRDRRSSLLRRRSSRARFANKVLGRLYSRRAFTGGLVFSRGHFLGDVSKMVAGLLSSDFPETDTQADQSFPSYGFGDKVEGAKDPISENLTDMVIHEQEGDSHIVHSSTLTSGKEGCVVLVFPKASLIPFLDEYPGLLLSLLGTQVVV